MARIHFVVVCGYGCHLEYSEVNAAGIRTTTPTPLGSYLDRVVEFTNYQRRKLSEVRSVILCGGPTQQQSAPGKTEAGVMFEYLSHQAVDQPYTLEGNSYTTHDNIQNAADRIRRLLWPVKIGESVSGRSEKCRITIFCEAQRDLAVEMAARHFMRDLVADVEGDIRTETYSWERAHPTKALWKANLMWLALRFPWLATLERRKKMRLSQSR